jgi:hypothetical protein
VSAFSTEITDPKKNKMVGSYAHKLFAVVVELALKCGLAKDPERKEAGKRISLPGQAGQAEVERTAQETAVRRKATPLLQLVLQVLDMHVV